MVHAGCVIMPVFIRLGHKCRDLLSPCDGYGHVHRPALGLYIYPKGFWGVESEPVLTLKENSPLPEAERRVDPATLHYTGQGAQHTTERRGGPRHAASHRAGSPTHH